MGSEDFLYLRDPRTAAVDIGGARRRRGSVTVARLQRERMQLRVPLPQLVQPVFTGRIVTQVTRAERQRDLGLAAGGGVAPARQHELGIEEPAPDIVLCAARLKCETAEDSRFEQRTPRAIQQAVLVERQRDHAEVCSQRLRLVFDGQEA
jgi:hypothetical protein